MNKRYVIIGAAAVGLGAIHKLRALDPESEIICISNEKENPYNKCLLADYMTGQPQGARIMMLSDEQAKQKNITLILGKHVTQIVTDNKCIMLDDGQQIAYDELLLGLGSSPRKLPLPDIGSLKGVFTFHTLADIHGIQEYIKCNTVHKAIVIGAGLSGLECADALTQLNIPVTIVEKNNSVLSTQLGQDCSPVIERAITNHGASLYKNDIVTSVDSENHTVSGVTLASGVSLKAQLVVIAAGLVPNVQLAEQAGIATDYGVVVNEYLQTNIPHIYAAGDMIMVKDHITGALTPSCTWPDAMLQGMTAACNMTGQIKVYSNPIIMTSSSFFGLKFAACGKPDASSTSWVSNESVDGYHSYLIAPGAI
ncbi:NADH oxidase [Candidatus Dependentiae bacterium Noda2021]|nr:NADH oxidase [Candidatus Dependentiae bacterium Noda2021]